MSEINKKLVGGGISENTPLIKRKQRNSNLELYRIIVMLFIVSHHYVVNGSGLSQIMRENPCEIYTIFYKLLGAWGKTGINCFVLITGYFMCKSDITLRKFLKLALEVVFYNVVIYFVFCISGYEEFSIKEAFLISLPVKNCNTGFTSAFILFYLAIPFLNILLQGLDRRLHMLLLALLLFVYTVLPMCLADVAYNYLSWFSVLYLIASYIRLYGLPRNDSAKFWGCTSLVALALSVVSILLPLAFHRECTYFFVSDSNHILAILTAVTSFMYFKNLKIGYSKIINTIATTTFGILLIHANGKTMRQFLWNDLFDNPGHYSMPIYAIGVIFLVFATCSLIDLIRIKTIETPLLNATEHICMNIYNKIKHLKK